MNIADPRFHPASPLTLPENEVHIWWLDLEPLSIAEDRWHQLLSTDEQARAKQFLVARPRQHFVLTRGLLRTLLAAYLGGDPKALTFRLSNADKPSLNPPYTDAGVHFNVSHTRGAALLAFARGREVGVDVEYVRRDLNVEAIARRFFSLHEQRQLAAVASEERYDAFFRCWTRKEAYIKAKGEGLSLPLAQFDVSLKPGDTNALLSTRPDGSEAAGWSLRDIPASNGYVAALCAAGHDWRLRD